MPELVPTYERLVELAGGSDGAARLLSLWCPAPYLTGCSQAVRVGEPNLLVRNYDYQPTLWDATQMATCWSGRQVVGMVDSLWGVLDGMNEDGLAVSLAFGGRRVVGEGFGMPLILRYVLETCRDVAEGAAALARVPTHMSYNVTLLDARGAYQTLFLAPDREPIVTHHACATNHQRAVEWDAFAHATASVERATELRAHLADPDESAARFVERFLEPPLYQTKFARGWGTLYTAIYDPGAGAMELRWPDFTLAQSIDDFRETSVALTYCGHPEPDPQTP